MLSDSNAACVATALALCFKKEGISSYPKHGRYKLRPLYTHTHTHTHTHTPQYDERNLKLSEPKDYKHFLKLDGPSFDELLKIVRGSHSQSAFIHCATLFGRWEQF